MKKIDRESDYFKWLNALKVDFDDIVLNSFEENKGYVLLLCRMGKSDDELHVVTNLTTDEAKKVVIMLAKDIVFNLPIETIEVDADVNISSN